MILKLLNRRLYLAREHLAYSEPVKVVNLRFIIVYMVYNHTVSFRLLFASEV